MMPLTTTTPSQINRECDGCVECCKGWLSACINGTPIYPDKPCRFMSTTGCTNYENRPVDPCITYKCEWLLDPNIPDWLKPDKSKVMVTHRPWGPNKEYIYWEVKECGVGIDTLVLDWFKTYCSSNNIQLRVEIDGQWRSFGTPEFLKEMNTMSWTFEELSLENPGVLVTKIPDDLFLELRASVKPAVDAAVPYHNDLVGNIEQEYMFPISERFTEFLNMMWTAYRERFQVWMEREYNIPDYAWINLMKKGEFNPLHLHDGVASWVAWVDIPYDLQEEIKTDSEQRRKYPTASMFQFVYNKLNGELVHMNLPIDSSWEGTMVMFPSYLRHQVYPFSTSDGQRISIASNINLV